MAVDGRRLQLALGCYLGHALALLHEHVVADPERLALGELGLGLGDGQALDVGGRRHIPAHYREYLLAVSLQQRRPDTRDAGEGV